MVPTQTMLLGAPALSSMDYLPAGVVAVVIASFALVLLLVSVRRRDAE